MTHPSVSKNYSLDWYIENQVLEITFRGHFSSYDATCVNDYIAKWIANHKGNLVLLINTLELATVVDFQDIRTRLAFVDSRRIRGIFVFTQSKLIRLSMLVIFSLSPATIKFFDSQQEAQQFVDSKLHLLL